MKPEELELGRRALEKGLLNGLEPLDPAAPAGELPRSIAGFEIRELLGRGAMGRVYRAWHPGLKKEVALKVLNEGEEGGNTLKRFMVEAQAAGRLSHPNI